MLIPAMFYTPIISEGEVGVLGKVIDKRGNSYTVFSKKLYYDSQWYNYKNYYKFYYNEFSTVPITTGKNVYVYGQVDKKGLKPIYIAPSNNFSMMKVKDNAINKMQENIENEEARDILISSFMGNIRDNEVFKKTGTLHLFAVSGMHVYILYGIVSFFVNFLILKRNARLIINSVIISFYLIFTGFTPSSVRAVLLLVTLNIFRFFDIPVSSFNILGLVGYINLLFLPNNILNVSFQMSYAAAFMILFTLERIDNSFMKTLIMPVAAYIGIFPIALINFGEISLTGLLITPLLTPAVTLLILCALLSIILPFNFITLFSTNFAIATKNFVNVFTFWEPIKFGSIFIPLVAWSFLFLLYVFVLETKTKRPPRKQRPYIKN